MAYIPTLNDIRDITPILSQSLGFDYTNYGFSFLKRRISYLFEELNIRRLPQFIEGVKDGSLSDKIKHLFPVATTELFRDPSFWRIIKSKVEKYSDNQNLVFWFPELSSTEELFSLLIILEDLNLIDKVKVCCNIDNLIIENELQRGYLNKENRELNKKNMKRVGESLNETDFIFEKEDGIFVNTELLRNVEIIKGHYFKSGPSMNSVYMIIFRNIMLNYNSKLQLDVETELFKYLKPDGFLALGIQERISNNSSDYVLYNKDESIYKAIK